MQHKSKYIFTEVAVSANRKNALVVHTSGRGVKLEQIQDQLGHYR
ncbi:hypothetical protein [Salipaludibacillus sp. CF4.18]